MRIPNPKLSRRGYVALTVAGILVPTLFLGLLGLHLVRQHYRFQSEILAEYGRFSVDYVASEIQRVVTGQERDIANYLQLLALASGFRAEDELRRVEDTYPLVESAFAYGEDGTLRFARRNAPPAGAAGASVQPSDSTRARAERILRRTLDDITVHHVMLSNEVHFYAGVENGAAYQYAAFPYRNSQRTEAGVMGYFLDVGYLRHQFLGRVLEKSIHEAEGRFAPDFGKTLTLVVRDEKGQSVHTHRHAGCEPKMAKIPCPKRDLAHAGLDDLLPGWRVGITYTDPRGFGWMRRIFTLQVALLVFASALVVAGTLVAMRFALRQMELSRLKSHFVSNITHEIKTPLAAIRLYTETLQQGRVRDRAEAERFLGIIHKESARLSALIDNILDLGRIEAGGRRYAFDPADLGAVVREVVDRYAFQLRDKGFDLQLEIEPGLPETLADRDAVGQAVLNLLDNAVKYSRETREVRITVNAEAGNGHGNGNGGGNGHGLRRRGNGVAHAAGAPNGKTGAGDKHANGHGSILIRVQDRGIGIPAYEQTKIFDTFYRVEKGLEHDVKGSGLGLALVKQVAEAHGGTIQVESRPGAGSTFTLQIPVRGPAVPRAGEPLEASIPSPTPDGESLEPEHAPHEEDGMNEETKDSKRLVLVVEDDEDMLLGLRHNLEFEGYETVPATSGREALQKAQKLGPDLVLLDVMLPELNGFEVLRELRTTAPRLPVILLTSKGLESDKLQGFRLGADDYVTKPFSIQELLARVQAVMKRAHPDVDTPESMVHIGDLSIDLARREVRRGDVHLALALKEYEMLRLFIRRKGEVVTREQLLHEVWGYDPENVPTTRTVDNHVAKLRQKIGADRIETVQKVGYRFLP